ncbi:heme utilization cystosolic carrier protein HutX [Flaviflagellibacter deserti]|uniref:Heme utilization cystosolic carrier protein HutX n=1 Tax=Flaviflagellibacter deserti TaxID=2267266 RepID=A0ABV9Z003_9HYPH
MTIAVSPDQERIRTALAEKPNGILEFIARDQNVPLRAVLAELPQGEATIIPGERFDDIWSEMTSWGDVLFLVHTKDVVAEITGSLPAGTHGHGYFNIHGDSPIGGHIKAENCAEIVLLDRAPGGRRSCSVQFMNKSGDAMFKVFVRRDEEKNLLADQVAQFEALKTWA